MDLKKLLSFLPFEKELVLNVYLLGSRMFGVYEENTDYDFAVVVCDRYRGTKKLEMEKEGVGLDVTLYTLSSFQSLVEEGDMEVLICLFLDPKFVWMEKSKIHFYLSLYLVEKNSLKSCTSNLF